MLCFSILLPHPWLLPLRLLTQPLRLLQRRPLLLYIFMFVFV